MLFDFNLLNCYPKYADVAKKKKKKKEWEYLKIKND